MAIKFSQFNERTASTTTMTLVGYDGNQNIRILADDLLANPYINGTENTLSMFGTGGTIVVDSIVSQDAGATQLTVQGELRVADAADITLGLTVGGDTLLNGNITLGDDGADLITQTGTLYLRGLIKDSNNVLGAADQFLVSDAAGQLDWTNLSDINVGTAEQTAVYAKNTSGSPILKGTPVYITGTVGATDVVEIAPADASNAAAMPALGLVAEDVNHNDFEYVVTGGYLTNITTDPIDGITPTSNDTVYVKSGGGLTLNKPTGSNLIQNIAKVGKVSGGNSGSLVVSSILRTNDVPNLTQGKIWVGSTGNTIESGVVHLDEVNNRMLINTTTATSTLSPDLEISGGGSPTIVLNAATSAPLNYSSNYIWATRNNSTSPPLGALGWDNTNTFDGVRLNARSILTYADSALELSTNAGGTSKIKILNSDVITIPNSTLNVGIGVTNPSQKLDIEGNIQLSDSTFVATRGLYGPNGPLITFNGLNFDTYVAGNAIRHNPIVAQMNFKADGVYDFFSHDAGTGETIFSYSGSEKMRIDGAGNVGIGTTTPNFLLNLSSGTQQPDIVGTSTNFYGMKIGHGYDVFSSSPGNITSKIEFQPSAAAGFFGDDIVFATTPQVTITNPGDGSTERMRITSSGNVGIGTTSPQAKLDVNGGVKIADDATTATGTNVGTLRYRADANNSYVDMVMQTGASTYAWVNIVQNNW